MTHFVVNEIKMIMPRCPQGSLKELKLKSSVMRDFSHTEMIRSADGKNGLSEYGSIGVLGIKCITPLLHHSSIPASPTLKRGGQAQRSRWAFFSGIES